MLRHGSCWLAHSVQKVAGLALVGLSFYGFTVRLRHHPRHRNYSQQLQPVIPFSWGLKQPRSRLSSTSGFDGAVLRRKDGDSTRCSPTTPLSWSGGASPSATADGFEESSRQTFLSHDAARSKTTATSEYTSCNTATAKRCRRKKTFAELLEEESSLLKEKTSLKKELATLNDTFKEQRARNERLKRMKLDVSSQSPKNPIGTGLLPTLSGQPHQRIAPAPKYVAPMTPTHSTPEYDRPLSDSCEENKTDSTQENFFVLPDLNMMPSEDDSNSDTLYGFS
ncbi:Major facilitator superfamily domain-containing protein [Quillaja saponaria]|uniref:Major facilitator superfamily domain-containing protein n=1 Tax=Quillaja saponaria TaxID=32244 RepID=A0AAD7M019_QUISA|nr:Major facilitator superfamily domain-containing protein [Quillaja saponaria]